MLLRLLAQRMVLLPPLPLLGLGSMASRGPHWALGAMHPVQVPDWLIIPGGNLGNVYAFYKGFKMCK